MDIQSHKACNEQCHQIKYSPPPKPNSNIYPLCNKEWNSMNMKYQQERSETHNFSCWRGLYVGESNENLKFVIKNWNFKPLSCKLVSVLQTACRMTCRWQHSADARTASQYQYKDGCPTWDLHQGRTALCYSIFA